MPASTTDNCVEQRWFVDMVMIKFHVIDPNNLLFRNVYFSQVAERGKAMYFYYLLIPGNNEQDPAMFLKPDVLHNKNKVPIDNSHPEGVIVIKMAKKIEALESVLGSI